MMNLLNFDNVLKSIPANILISRTDSIGDVVLVLPLAKYLKEFFPTIKLGFLGRNYTKPVIDACENIDEFIELHDFLNKEVKICGQKPQCILHLKPDKIVAEHAKKIKIPLRVGTRNRPYHWNTCNKLIALSRKNSYQHEAILNLKFLSAFGIKKTFSLREIGDSYGLTKVKRLEPSFKELIDKSKFNLIIHPKSRGNAREWPLSNFTHLIHSLDKDQYKIFISGTEKEGEIIKDFLSRVKDETVDITGKMELSQFISFINACDGLIANSTGPIHLAAALGKHAFGIYPPMWPINAIRWGPLGKNVHVFVIDKKCNDCRKTVTECECIKQIEPLLIKEELDKTVRKKTYKLPVE